MEVKSVCGACGETAVVSTEAKGMDPLTGKPAGQWMEPDGAGFIAKRKKTRGKKPKYLGAVPSNQNGKKDAEDELLEEEDITLDEVKEFASEYFGGKTLDAGTGNGLHVVQIERGDGSVVEAYFDEKTADFRTMIMLDPSLISEKSLEGESVEVISSAQAYDLAVKAIDEHLSVKTALVEEVGVLADEFEGEDAWVVPVRSESGEDYDVFIALNGTVLGYDSYHEEAKSDVEGDVKDAIVDGAKSDEAAGDEPKEDEKEDKDKKDEADEKTAEVIEADADFLASLAEFQTLAAETV